MCRPCIEASGTIRPPAWVTVPFVIFDRETVPFVILEATAVPMVIIEAVPLVILLFCEAPGQSQPKLPSPAPRIASAKT